MEQTTAEASLEKDTILADVARILEHMTSDWDLEFSGTIGSDTCLIADMAFESIDMVQFVVAIQEQFKQRDLPFEKLLMHDGRYVDDLRVEDIVNFLCEYLKQ